MKHTTVFGSVLSISLICSVAGAADLSFKLGHTGTPGSLVDVGAKHFANCFNNELSGDAKIEVLGPNTFGNEHELLKLVDSGTLDFALPASAMMSVDNKFQVFSLPNLILDRSHMKRANKFLEKTLSASASKNGYKLLGLWESDFDNISNSVRPVKTPADLKGLKIRASNDGFSSEIFKKMGIDANPLSFTEVYTALQTGLVDGQDLTIQQFHEQKFYEVQRFFSISNHSYVPTFLISNDEKFSTLPLLVKNVAGDCANFTQEYLYGYALWRDSEILNSIKEKGVQVHAVDHIAFRTASKKVYENFAMKNQENRNIVDGVDNLSTEVMRSSKILATRIFSGPKQYPPKHFSAYGIVAFNSRKSLKNRSRYLTICHAYIATLPHTTEVSRSRSEQMVTVWPVHNDKAGKRLNSAPREKICESAVDRYGLVMAKQALRDATFTGKAMIGNGPYLLAWAPAHKKGEKDTPVLVLDLSHVSTYDQAVSWFLKWHRDIERDPDIWHDGWDFEAIQLYVRDWLDNTGNPMLSYLEGK